MKTANIEMSGVRLFVLVPETEQERQIGLSRGLPAPYEGMVFVFDPPAIANMTMRYTSLGLQIGFVDETMTVRTVHQAPAHSGVWTSSFRCRCAIELPRHGPRMEAGMQIRFR